MAYMVAGYLIIWFASFAFIISMVQRQRGLRHDIEMLKELADQRKPVDVQVTTGEGVVDRNAQRAGLPEEVK
jgi:hypothetical protein